MICVICTKRIHAESQEFEEVGPIEFAHTACKDRVEGIEEEAESQEVEMNNQ